MQPKTWDNNFTIKKPKTIISNGQSQNVLFFLFFFIERRKNKRYTIGEIITDAPKI